MLTLCYSPGACSLAPHILLEETGAPFTPRLVSLKEGAQKTEAFRELNPLGRVPVLIDGDTVITENTAILPYIARRFPDAGLLPADPLQEARALSLIGFIASSVHIAFAHLARPERYSADPATFPAIQAMGRSSFHGFLHDLDQRLTGRDWYLDQFSICDPYLLVCHIWGRRLDLQPGELPALAALADRLFARPAVRRAMDREGLPLTPA